MFEFLSFLSLRQLHNNFLPCKINLQKTVRDTFSLQTSSPLEKGLLFTSLHENFKSFKGYLKVILCLM
jgi:hypothetical protein